MVREKTPCSQIHQGPHLGCGTGRVALHLQQEGHRVIGIDISPEAVEASRMRGFDDVRIMSAEELRFSDQTFDTILLPGNSFGISGSPERTRRMLERLHDVTKDDTVILAESVNVLKTNSPRHLAYHQKNREQGRPLGLVRIRLIYKGQVSDWFELWLALPQEMKSVVERAEWYLDKTIGEEGSYIGILREE